MRHFLDKTTWMVLGLVVVLAGCGNGQDYDQLYNSYNYKFTETFGSSTCTTGDQSFLSLTDLCTALQRDSVNNNCALAQRQLLFTSHSCPGSFNKRF